MSTSAPQNYSKQALRLIVKHVREHETNPVLVEATNAAVAPLNAAISAHAEITQPMVAAALISVMQANTVRGNATRTFTDALQLPEVVALSKGETTAPQPQVEAPKPTPTKAATGITRPRFDDIPEGSYAFEAEDGHVAFAQVVHRTYESGTYAFANLLVGAPGDWRHQRLSRDAGAAVLAKIQAAGAEQSARLFGQKTEICGHCHSPLSNPQSRAAGYGPDCARNHGYWYPSLAEALEVLGEVDPKCGQVAA